MPHQAGKHESDDCFCPNYHLACARQPSVQQVGLDWRTGSLDNGQSMHRASGNAHDPPEFENYARNNKTALRLHLHEYI
eukprot:8770392-Heterocapsa_arctica.AAC.1